MKEILEELRRDVKVVRESQIRMEGDLKYHIRRTDILVDAVENQRKLLEPMVVFRFLRNNSKFIVTILAAVAGAIAIMVDKGII